MRVVQTVLRQGTDLSLALEPLRASQPQCVLAFGTVGWLQRLQPFLVSKFPDVCHLGCTTAGEISNEGLTDDSCVLTAIHFDNAQVQCATTTLTSMEDSFAAGQRLAQEVPTQGLRAVVVLGQGVNINCSALIGGMAAVFGPSVLITGGLAGDAANFQETWVLDHTGVYKDRIACIGLYGAGLSVSHGSVGGWMPFGPARKVTRSTNNVLFELDGEPALAVYKRYLGDHAKDLPASGLLFPFAMLGKDQGDAGLIRTILAVDEAQGSLTLAGDIDPDGYLRLMHASTDALVDGAEVAAQAAKGALQQPEQSLALLVSCVGRKLVMGGRAEEEIEAVAEVLGKSAVLTGFYSYGEISPFAGELSCKLHNQTMTITHITECELSPDA